jgi:Mycothiol maleylpyruvate isomerase N-terminal domain
MDQSFRERNAEGLERLRALITSLSDDELTRSVGEQWTVSVVLAHLAFWDRFLAARWTYAADNDLRIPPATPDFVADLINDAALEGWQSCPPHDSAQQAMAAAENIERIVGALDEDTISEIIVGGRLPMIDRTRHWFQHIGQIESVLGR